jgi:hypothetical protein
MVQAKTNSVSYKGDTLIWDFQIYAEFEKDSWVNPEKKRILYCNMSKDILKLQKYAQQRLKIGLRIRYC